MASASPAGVSPRDGANNRVFNIDVSICPQCGGEARVIACIEDQAIIDKILDHLMKKGALPPSSQMLPATRASPYADWFG